MIEKLFSNHAHPLFLFISMAYPYGRHVLPVLQFMSSAQKRLRTMASVGKIYFAAGVALFYLFDDCFWLYVAEFTIQGYGSLRMRPRPIMRCRLYNACISAQKRPELKRA